MSKDCLDEIARQNERLITLLRTLIQHEAVTAAMVLALEEHLAGLAGAVRSHQARLLDAAEPCPPEADASRLHHLLQVLRKFDGPIQ